MSLYEFSRDEKGEIIVRDAFSKKRLPPEEEKEIIAACNLIRKIEKERPKIVAKIGPPLDIRAN